MWSVILVWTVFGVLQFGPLVPLGAVLVSHRLGPAAYGWMETALGAGTVLGGVAALRLRPQRPLAAGAALMTAFGLLPPAIAVHAPLPALLTTAAVNGAVWAFWSVMWQTSVQSHVRPELLNRVTSFEVLGSDGSLPLGQALAGPGAALVGAERVLGVSAAVGVLGCATLLTVPAVRRLGRAPHPAPALAPSER